MESIVAISIASAIGIVVLIVLLTIEDHPDGEL